MSPQAGEGISSDSRPSDRDDSPRRVRCGRTLVFVCVALWLVYLGWIALRLTIDYYDTFETFGNARAIVTHDRSLATMTRTIGLSVFFAPVFLVEKWVSWDGFAFKTCHLLSVGLYALLLWFSYRLFRDHLRKPTALLGVALLAVNPQLLHWAPFSKEDIPGALLTTAAFYCYLKSLQTRRTRDLLITGVLIWAAMITRYNLTVLLFVVIFCYELLSRQISLGFSGESFLFLKGDRVRARFLALFVLPVALFLFFPAMVLPALRGTPFYKAPTEFFFLMFNYFKQVSGHENPRNAYGFLLNAFTWPLLLCALAGLLRSRIHRDRVALFYFLWLAIFFLCHAYLIGHKEARFLFPLFPPLYYFVLRGLEEGSDALERLLPVARARWAARIGLGVLILAVPVHRSVRECRKFSDPVYTVDFEKSVSLYAKQQAGPNGAYWCGPLYSIHAKDFVFHRADVTTYIFDFSNGAVRFFARRPVKRAWWAGMEIVAPGDEGTAAFVRQVAAHARDGDVFIVNPEPRNYQTDNMPPTLKPLVVERMRIRRFHLASRAPEGDRFAPTGPDPGTLTVRSSEGRRVIEGTNVADGSYELYLQKDRSATPVSIGIIRVEHGAFVQAVGGWQLKLLTPEAQVLLVDYDSVQAFYPPNQARQAGSTTLGGT